MKIGRYLIGLASGLTFGMLFAPKKGKELRKALSIKGNKSGADGLRLLGDAFMDAGQEAWVEFKKLSEHEQVEAMLDMSKEKMSEYLDKCEGDGYDIAEVAQEKLEDLGSFVTKKISDFKKLSNEVEKKTTKKAKKVVKKTKKKAKKTIKKVTTKAKKVTTKKAKTVKKAVGKKAKAVKKVVKKAKKTVKRVTKSKK